MDIWKFRKFRAAIIVPTAKEKTLGPSTVVNFMEYESDLILFEVHLPQEKLDKCTVSFVPLEGSKTMLHKLQLVISLLNCASIPVVVPWRAFLRCLIDLTVDVHKPHYHIHITGEVKLDLHIWLNFLSTNNGNSMLLSEMFLAPDVLHIYNESTGFTVIFKTH